MDLEEAAAELRQNAWLLGEYWQALRSVGLPDDLAQTLVADYHYNCLIYGDDLVEDD